MGGGRGGKNTRACDIHPRSDCILKILPSAACPQASGLAVCNMYSTYCTNRDLRSILLRDTRVGEFVSPASGEGEFDRDDRGAYCAAGEGGDNFGERGRRRSYILLYEKPMP